MQKRIVDSEEAGEVGDASGSNQFVVLRQCFGVDGAPDLSDRALFDARWQGEVKGPRIGLRLRPVLELGVTELSSAIDGANKLVAEVGVVVTCGGKAADAVQVEGKRLVKEHAERGLVDEDVVDDDAEGLRAATKPVCGRGQQRKLVQLERRGLPILGASHIERLLLGLDFAGEVNETRLEVDSRVDGLHQLAQFFAPSKRRSKGAMTLNDLLEVVAHMVNVAPVTASLDRHGSSVHASH